MNSCPFLLLISPAKTFTQRDNAWPSIKIQFTKPQFLTQSSELLRILKKLSVSDISKLMKISGKLGLLNYKRNQEMPSEVIDQRSRPALFYFMGDVYRNIRKNDYNEKDLLLAQKTLRILSGFYGILKPLDLISEYRLEMGTKLHDKSWKNLYDFWSGKVTESINKDINSFDNFNCIINLASEEYFKVINQKKIVVPIINIIFMDQNKAGQYKVIGLSAKKARGAMTDFIIKEKISDLDAIKKFTRLGYKFSEKDSKNGDIVFLRDHKDLV